MIPIWLGLRPLWVNIINYVVNVEYCLWCSMWRTLKKKCRCSDTWKPAWISYYILLIQINEKVRILGCRIQDIILEKSGHFWLRPRYLTHFLVINETQFNDHNWMIKAFNTIFIKKINFICELFQEIWKLNIFVPKLGCMSFWNSG